MEGERERAPIWNSAKERDELRTVGGCCGNMKLNNKITGGSLILSNIIMIYE